MPQIRIRNTDAPSVRERATQISVRSEGRDLFTEVISAGTPIGLLLALTYAVEVTVLRGFDAVPSIRIKNT